MEKELTPLEAFVRLEQSSKRYKGRKEDLDIIFTSIKQNQDLKERIVLNKASFEIDKMQYEKQLKALEIIKNLPIEERLMLLNAIYTYTKSEEKYDLVKGELL